ncbi:MAG: hypothetical protein ABGZ35_33800 [Planctomycetaceae bacterium]|jgi:hypothetical protein
MMSSVEYSVCRNDLPVDDRQIRRRLILFLLVGGCVLLGLVFPFPVGGRMWSHLFDLAHAPVFCLLLVVSAGLLDPGSIGLSPRFVKVRKLTAGETMVLAGGCLLLGCLGEFLQIFVGRSPSASDLAANAAGVLTGVLWMRSCRAIGGQRLLLVSAALIVLVSAMVRPALGVWGAIQQASDFPVLASFERPVDLGAWAEIGSSMQRTAEWSSDGTHSLSVNLFPGRFSGVNMIWPMGDWRGYDRLSWDIRNTSTTSVRLTMKINDRQHAREGFDPQDRFEFSFVVAPTAVHSLSVDLNDVFTAPNTRTMCMDQIAAVELFAVNLQQSHTLMLDHMRLAKVENSTTSEPNAALE